MGAFVWTMVIIMILDVAGKAAVLYTRDFTRKPAAIAIDIFIGACFIAWGAFLLGSA